MPTARRSRGVAAPVALVGSGARRRTFAAGFAPSVVASWGEVGAAAALGVVMGLLLVATQGRPLEGLLPFIGAFVITTLGITMLSGLVGSTGVTLIVLPALFITVPGDTLSAAAAELLGMRLTAGAARLAGIEVAIMAASLCYSH